MGLPAVKKMVEKLDDRKPGHGGYVTTTPEIIEILGQLSKLVPAVILVEEDSKDAVSVMIKIGFTLERDLL